MSASSSSSSFIQPANRMASFKSYFFADLNQHITALRKRGLKIIRLDIGSPDMPPADFIVDKLVEQSRRSDTHAYTPYGGTADFHQAVTEYYGKRFGVELTPQKETVLLIGSKEGLFALSQVLLNPGDITLVPDPGYPTYQAGAIIAGAEVYKMPLLPKNNFLPDLKAIPDEIARRAKVMWLNYPNNPTGAIAPLEYFQQAVEYAQKHEIVIAHDAPYVDVCFDGYRAPSILEVPGAKEVAVEFNSLSKTYNMAGWRVGMAVGNEKVIGYLHTYKSQADTAHFGPIITASITAISGDQSWTEQRNQVYQERRDTTVSMLRAAGFSVEPPPAAIYVWARLPERYTDSMNFCSRLLEDTGVSITPGPVYGGYGECYVRVSLCTPNPLIHEAMQRMQDWMKNS